MLFRSRRKKREDRRAVSAGGGQPAWQKFRNPMSPLAILEDGELALIDGGPRMETVTATTELVCYAINYWDFRPFVIANGVIGWKLLQGLAQMLRDVGEG